ncbi:hypothetical protein [Tychonema sp. LEGE 07203]|uniref:hypothetical protein n=1 Tax=Tychonema sp. LEGE 07203 TaxID=1828671 RepID=UPI00187E13C5|nr:hypothetical protein [Tychonema sp. LEGE 07203]MBE9095640.1 hypothetical protein [Tychonema sp. LEGE 07203]
MSLVFAYGIGGQDVPILSEELLVSSSTPSLFRSTAWNSTRGSGIVNSLALIPTRGYTPSAGLMLLWRAGQFQQHF